VHFLDVSACSSLEPLLMWQASSSFVENSKHPPFLCHQGLLAPIGWRRAVQRLGLRLSARQCDELFAVVDRNGDGAVDIHELLAWLNAEQGMPAQQRAAVGAASGGGDVSAAAAAAEAAAAAASSVAQMRATEAVGGAIGKVVTQQFGGSAETAFLWLLEVTPRALNLPDAAPPQAAPDSADSEEGSNDDDEDLSFNADLGFEFGSTDDDEYARAWKEQQTELDAEHKEALLSTSFTRRGWIAAMQRLFMLSSSGIEPSARESAALFFLVTGMQADVVGYLRLPEFKRLCALGGGHQQQQQQQQQQHTKALAEEMRPPAAVEYIGRHWESVLAGLETAAETARRTGGGGGGGFGGGGLDQTVGQAAEGYATVSQLRRVLSQPGEPATGRSSSRSSSSTGGGGQGGLHGRPRLRLPEEDWVELGRLADPKSSGVFDCEAFIRYAHHTHT
jgi:hypothetical protein